MNVARELHIINKIRNTFDRMLGNKIYAAITDDMLIEQLMREEFIGQKTAKRLMNMAKGGKDGRIKKQGQATRQRRLS